VSPKALAVAQSYDKATHESTRMVCVILSGVENANCHLLNLAMNLNCGIIENKKARKQENKKTNFKFYSAAGRKLIN